MYRVSDIQEREKSGLLFYSLLSARTRFFSIYLRMYARGERKEGERVSRSLRSAAQSLVRYEGLNRSRIMRRMELVARCYLTRIEFVIRALTRNDVLLFRSRGIATPRLRAIVTYSFSSRAVSWNIAHVIFLRDTTLRLSRNGIVEIRVTVALFSPLR